MEEDFQEHLDWLAKKYQLMLAAYMNKTILIEDKIDELLTICFLGQSEKKWLYVNLMLSDMPFGNKTKKLRKTLKELKPKLSKLLENETLFERLEKIRKTRNLFAHSLLNTNPAYLAKERKDEIALLNPRKKEPHTPIKLRDFDEWNQDAKSVLKILTNSIENVNIK